MNSSQSWRVYYGNLPGLGDIHAGSYLANPWFNGSWWSVDPSDVRENWIYRSEGDVADPSSTPLVADALSWPWTGWGAFGAFGGIGWAQTDLWTGPMETEPPPADLEFGVPGILGMHLYCIPRHGSRSSVVPNNFDISQKLPGAINIDFADGHVEQTKLERLWQLPWHRNYRAPTKRPGLN